MSGASDIVLLARVAGSLIVVVLLALLAARFARRLPQGRHSGDLHVCERVGLTRETAAVVLESDGRRLLVGVSPSQVTLLADLGPTTAVSATTIGALEAPPLDPQTHAPRTLETRALEPQTLEPQALEPRTLEPRTLEPRTLEPRTPRQDVAPVGRALQNVIPAQRQVHSTEADGVRMTTVPLSRRSVRELQKRRRPAVPPTQRGTGSVLDPRTWQQGLEALRDLTARRP